MVQLSQSSLLSFSVKLNIIIVIIIIVVIIIPAILEENSWRLSYSLCIRRIFYKDATRAMLRPLITVKFNSDQVGTEKIKSKCHFAGLQLQLNKVIKGRLLTCTRHIQSVPKTDARMHTRTRMDTHTYIDIHRGTSTFDFLIANMLWEAEFLKALQRTDAKMPVSQRTPTHTPHTCQNARGSNDCLLTLGFLLTDLSLRYGCNLLGLYITTLALDLC